MLWFFFILGHHRNSLAELLQSNRRQFPLYHHLQVAKTPTVHHQALSNATSNLQRYSVKSLPTRWTLKWHRRKRTSINFPSHLIWLLKSLERSWQSLKAWSQHRARVDRWEVGTRSQLHHRPGVSRKSAEVATVLVPKNRSTPASPAVLHQIKLKVSSRFHRSALTASKSVNTLRASLTTTPFQWRITMVNSFSPSQVEQMQRTQWQAQERRDHLQVETKSCQTLAALYPWILRVNNLAVKRVSLSQSRRAEVPTTSTLIISWSKIFEFNLWRIIFILVQRKFNLDLIFFRF